MLPAVLGSYATNRQRQLTLNSVIYHVKKKLEENGEPLNQELKIRIGESGQYEYTVAGTWLARFQADVFGKADLYCPGLAAPVDNAGRKPDKRRVIQKKTARLFIFLRKEGGRYSEIFRILNPATARLIKGSQYNRFSCKTIGR